MCKINWNNFGLQRVALSQVRRMQKWEFSVWCCAKNSALKSVKRGISNWSREVTLPHQIPCLVLVSTLPEHVKILQSSQEGHKYGCGILVVGDLRSYIYSAYQKSEEVAWSLCIGTYIWKRCGNDSKRIFNYAVTGISRLNGRKLKLDKFNLE